MTNSRLTDPEILKTRFAAALEELSTRCGSGGKGRHKAGDGTRRTIRFPQTMECAILRGHRRAPPFGLGGGEAGELGRNFVRRADAVTVITPTDGGFGPAVIDGERLQGRVWLRKSRVVQMMDATLNCNLYE